MEVLFKGLPVNRNEASSLGRAIMRFKRMAYSRLNRILVHQKGFLDGCPIDRALRDHGNE